MKRSIRKIIAFLLAAVTLAAVFAGCDKEPDESTEELPPEKITLDLTAAETIYIVRPENCSDKMIKETQQLMNEVKQKTGAKLTLSDDWYRDEADIDRYEILLGDVERPEVAADYHTIRANDYIIRFSEKKLWIVGGTEKSTFDASAAFRAILGGMQELKFEAEGGLLAKETGTYEINESRFLGKEFRDFGLVYSSNIFAQENAVSGFVESVQKKSGYVLKKIRNINSQEEQKIVLKASYPDKTKVALYDYEVSIEGTDVTVYGGSGRAFRHALDLLFDAFCKGELAEEGSAVTIKGTYSYLHDDIHEELCGIRMYALGDSYFAGAEIDRTLVWPSLLALKYQMNFQNYGIGGSTISNYTTEHNPMVDRLSKMSRISPDIVIFEGGRNDFSMVTPLGDKDSHDTKTFRGAIRVCIEKMHETYPNALIICVTNWNFPGNHGITDSFGYAKAFKETADSYDYAICINATDRNLIPVDAADENFRTEFFIKPTDISHLNKEGMRYVEPYFEELIARYYTAFLNGALAGEK